MASQLKNILHFSIPNGGALSLPHGLNWSGIPKVPDNIVPSTGGFEITADATNVTVDGVGDVDVLVESWHTIERAFGDESIENLTPQPFVAGTGAGGIPTPAFSQVVTTIYARTTGSDTTGNGETPATAYATFQRAVRDVPLIVPPGQCFVVDITGINELLPQDYLLPPWKAAGDGDFPISVEAQFLSFLSPVQIFATPELVPLSPASDAIINSADVTSSADPITGLITLTLHVPRPSWSAGATVIGKQVVGTVGDGENCVIGHVGAGGTSILISGRNVPTFPIQIMQPSATLHGSGVFFGTVGAINCDAIGFAGIRIISDNGGNGLYSSGVGSCICELCELDSPFMVSNANGIFFAIANRVLRSWAYGNACFGGTLGMVQGFLQNAQPVENFGIPLFVAPITPLFRQMIVDGCDSLEVRVYEPGGNIDGATTDHFLVQNTLVRNGVGDGMTFHGGKAHVVASSFAGNAGNGITVQRGGGLIDIHSSGSGVAGVAVPNGGVGIHVDDGMQAIVDAATSGSATPLAGVGGQITIGAQAPTTWAVVAAPPNNITDYAGAAATGARLAQK